jgi:HEAT repeat protein
VKRNDAASGSSVTSDRVAITLAAYADNAIGVREGLHHLDPTCRSAALSGLDRCGALTKEDLLAGLDDLDQGVIHRACELSSRLGTFVSATIDERLLALLQGPTDSLAEVAAWSLGERHEAQDDIDPPKAVVDALVHAVRTHTDALVREAAVAAIGSIGAPDGLEAVLHATKDKATVRRRAVIALAAFEGEEVDAALQNALTDRDWQVRQAAEDLLEGTPSIDDAEREE